MNSNEKAYEAAGKYLSKRMHTETEVIKHLKDKGFGEEEIQYAVDELKMLRYIDDFQYCLSFIEYSYNKIRGAIRIKAELAKKGVLPQIIDEAYEEYTDENLIDEFVLALKYAESSCKERCVIDEKQIAKIGRGLETRGFSPDNIYKVVGEMYKWKDLKELSN